MAVAKMTKKRASVLAPRIKAGKADPISSEEKAIVASLRMDFEKKYGRRAASRAVKTSTKTD